MAAQFCGSQSRLELRPKVAQRCQLCGTATPWHSPRQALGAWAAALRQPGPQGDCCPFPALGMSMDCCQFQQKRGVPVGVPKVTGPRGACGVPCLCAIAEQATRPVLTEMPPQLLRLTFWVDQMDLSLCDYSQSKGRMEKGWGRVQRERFGCWRVRSASGMLRLCSTPPGCL